MLPILLLATLAHAETPYKGGGKATVSGVSELTLYAPPVSQADGWYVQASVGEKSVLLRLGSGGRGADGRPLRLTPGAAKKLGFKVTGAEGKETASFKDLALGEVKLSGTASIGPVGMPGDVGGVIDVAAFPDLAWAIEPASGKVKVGPSGAGSVAAALGQGVAFVQSGKRSEKIGTRSTTIPARTLVLAEATVSGVAMPARVALDGSTSVAIEVDGAEWFKVGGVENPKYPLPPVEGARVGEREFEFREIGVAGQSAWVAVMRSGHGLDYRFGPPASLGFDVLAGFDVGVDAGLGTFVLRPATGTVRASYVDIREAELRKAAEAPPAEGADADAAKKAQAGALEPLVSFLVDTAQAAEAVEAGKKWSEAAPERCSSWHGLGRAQALAGDYAGAVVSLRKAADLYQPWAVRPLDERTRLAKDEDKRSKRADFDGVWSQPHSCHTAWGELGGALIASGNAAGVAELYPKYVDLDPALPRAAGNALLLQGDAAGAEAAYRQAIQLSYMQDGLARGGMMLATRARSLELARAQFEGNLDTEHGTLRYWLAYGELVRGQGGTAAVDAVGALAARMPWHVPALLALATEQAAAGQDASATLAKAGERLALLAQQYPDGVGAMAWRAEYLRQLGKLPEAAAEAERAMAAAPEQPLAYFVRARVAQSAGDNARAAELYRKAGQVGALDPLYSSLLSLR